MRLKTYITALHAALFAILLAVSPAGSGSMTLLGTGKPAAVAGYTGPGDVVGGALYWWGLSAYSAAKAGTKAANICNSGDANCADVNTLANGKFDVATAQGAPLNCAGAGGTCTVKALYDQSGNTNCGAAVCDITQANSALRPTLTFSCAGLGAGIACITFVGASNQFLQNTTGFTQSQPFTITVVAKDTNTAAQQTVHHFASDARIGYNNPGANTAFCFSGSVLSATAADAAWHSIQAMFNSAGSPQGDCNVDGTATTGSAGANNIVATTTLTFGAFGTGVEVFTGTAVQGGAWGIAFSSTQSSNMSANAHTNLGF